MRARLLRLIAGFLFGVVATALLGIAGTPTTAPVRAGTPLPSASAAPTAGGVIVGAGSGGSPGTGSSGGLGNGGESYCAWNLLNPYKATELGIGGPMPGHWWELDCGGTSLLALQWFQDATPPTIDPAVLAQQAESLLKFPTPTISTAPPANAGAVVNLATWLWINPSAWQTKSATAAAGPVSATATAQPAEVVWSTGDGRRVTCDGPGTPYNSSAPDQSQHTGCSYTYQQSSGSQPGQKYTLIATMYWHVTWTAQGAPGGGDMGLLPGPSTSIPLEVDEIHAINQ